MPNIHDKMDPMTHIVDSLATQGSVSRQMSQISREGDFRSHSWLISQPRSIW
jgi:hypothetical protein